MQATSADPDVSNWDTANVTDMTGMFQGATSADPDVHKWNISKIIEENNTGDRRGLLNMFGTCGLSQENYENALIRFAAHNNPDNGLSLPKNLRLGKVSNYAGIPLSACGSDEAQVARQLLIDNGWSINDVPCGVPIG